MRLELFRSLWGWPTGAGADWARCGAECRENRFVGVEARLPGDAPARRALKAALANEGLDYIAVVFTGGDVIPDQAWTPAQHLDRLAKAIEGAHDVGARVFQRERQPQLSTASLSFPAPNGRSGRRPAR